VIEHASIVLVLREDPLKVLYVGFDTVGLPREVIVDHPPWQNGLEVVIHAATLTSQYFELLQRG
jgi:hypothetical protein